MMKKVWIGMFILSLVNLTGAKAEWFDEMKFKGDLRYRFENVDEEGKDARQRDRIRARFGIFPRVNKEVDLGIQLTTGEEKANKRAPTSGNATLTDVSGKKGIFLDLAYFDYRPEFLKGFNLTGGKIKNPFICVGDYIWDGDVTPEGLAAGYHVGSQLELLANAGYFWIYESSADDNKMLGGQLALKVKPSSDSYIMAGGSVYKFTDIKGTKAADLNWQGEAKAFGNSTESVVSGSTTNVLYADDFLEVEPFVEIGFKVVLPVKLFASYVVNTDADDNKNGFMAGVKLGKAGEPGTFEIAYDYRKLEKNAALGALADSDSWGGGTDGKGHKISAKYQLLKNWQLGAAFLIDDKKLDDSTTYKRLQIDLAANF
ncbi:MAG: putative porin [Lentisphaerota bacterium]